MLHPFSCPGMLSCSLQQMALSVICNCENARQQYPGYACPPACTMPVSLSRVQCNNTHGVLILSSNPIQYYYTAYHAPYTSVVINIIIKSSRLICNLYKLCKLIKIILLSPLLHYLWGGNSSTILELTHIYVHFINLYVRSIS